MGWAHAITEPETLAFAPPFPTTDLDKPITLGKCEFSVAGSAPSWGTLS